MYHASVKYNALPGDARHYAEAISWTQADRHAQYLRRIQHTGVGDEHKRQHSPRSNVADRVEVNTTSLQSSGGA